MASTTFIDNQTVIYAAWLNDVNNAVYNGIFSSSSITATNMICTGAASGAGFTSLINNTFASPGAIGNVTPNSGAFTTLTSTTTTSLGGTALAIRGLNFSHGEIVWVPESGTLNILNLCDSTGSNGSNYSLLVRGLASNGSTGANLAQVSFDTNSFLINGSEATTISQFAKSQSANGYQKLPGGTIIQWGLASAPDDSSATLTFPIAFPNACLSVTATMQMTSATSGSASVGVGGISTTGATLYGMISGPGYATGYAYWMAIGY